MALLPRPRQELQKGMSGHVTNIKHFSACTVKNKVSRQRFKIEVLN